MAKFPNWSKQNIVDLFTLYIQGLRREYADIPTKEEGVTTFDGINLSDTEEISKQYVDNRIDNDIADAKTEIIGGVTADYNTLLKLKDYFSSITTTLSDDISTYKNTITTKVDTFINEIGISFDSYKTTLTDSFNAYKITMDNQYSNFVDTIDSRIQSKIDVFAVNIGNTIDNINTAIINLTNKVDNSQILETDVLSRDLFMIGREIGSFYTSKNNKNLGYGLTTTDIGNQYLAGVQSLSFTNISQNEQDVGDRSKLVVNTSSDDLDYVINIPMKNLIADDDDINSGRLGMTNGTISMLIKVDSGEVTIEALTKGAGYLLLRSDGSSETSYGIDPEVVVHNPDAYVISKYPNGIFHIMIELLDRGTQQAIYLNGVRLYVSRPDGIGDTDGKITFSTNCSAEISQIRIWGDKLSTPEVQTLSKLMLEESRQLGWG